MSTVRFRLTALATVIVLIVLLGAAIALVVVQTDLLVDQLDDRLTQRADDLASLVRAGELPETIGGINDDTVSQVVGPDGSVLAASPALEGVGPIVDSSEPLRTRPRDAALSIDDDTYRLASRYVFGSGLDSDGPAGGREVTSVYVASALDDVRESASLLARTLVAIVPAVVAVVAALGWWITGRTLRPVEAIRSEVADIGATDLHRRVPEPRTDDEIARLARTMNAMLDRVEDGARRQQRFVADASHELRGPLTRIRSELEVDLSHPDRADALATHRSVLAETVELQQLVDDLLALARADAGAAELRRDPVDLDDIVLGAAQRAREAGQLAVDIGGVTAAQVFGDRTQLARAVGNVVDNAARHAAARMTLTLGAPDDATVVLTVADDGPGIPAAEHERVFDRFTRLDPARGAATGGSGLGLAIAREIVARHGGTIVVDSTHSPGARFVITLPATPTATGR
jgi:signal transduction histidine kinase